MVDIETYRIALAYRVVYLREVLLAVVDVHIVNTVEAVEQSRQGVDYVEGRILTR